MAGQQHRVSFFGKNTYDVHRISHTFWSGTKPKIFVIKIPRAREVRRIFPKYLFL